MAASQDTEITLGTGKLLVLFFFLVGVCALFFGFGYSLGRKSEPTLTTTATNLPTPQTSSNTSKSASGASAAPPMTFYKSVEQKDANPQLTPAAETKTDSNGANPTNPGNATSAQNTPAKDPSAPPDPMAATTPAPSYFVQVAAVSKQEDADALVDALKKKQYPAFVAAQSAADKLFHVQVGPFSDIKDAESMRTRLVGDGYSPILKR